MGMWRLTTKEDRTLLYVSISKAVKESFPDNYSASAKARIIKTIYEANKKYYDIHFMQMSEFINDTSTSSVRTTKP